MMINKQHRDYIVLDPAAYEYFRKILSHGSSLSKGILERLDLESGRIVSYLPCEMDIHTIRSYSQSVGASRDQAVSWLIGQIQACLTSGKHKAILMENNIVSPTDPVLRDVVLLENREVLYPILSEDADNQEQIREKLANAEFIPVFIGAIGELKNLDLDRKKLDAFITTVSAIFIGAFDGESYLWWAQR